MIRSYSALRRLDTFEDRYRYLALRGEVAGRTFGADRWMNQQFYSSREWRDLRREVVLRDGACDLGVEGFEINSKLLIHHINPVRVEDIAHHNDEILDPEFLITTTLRTHNAIHFGDESKLARPLVDRFPGDTKLW